jgi:hypothetical protein
MRIFAPLHRLTGLVGGFGILAWCGFFLVVATIPRWAPTQRTPTHTVEVSLGRSADSQYKLFYVSGAACLVLIFLPLALSAIGFLTGQFKRARVEDEQPKENGVWHPLTK